MLTMKQVAKLLDIDYPHFLYAVGRGRLTPTSTNGRVRFFDEKAVELVKQYFNKLRQTASGRLKPSTKESE